MANYRTADGYIEGEDGHSWMPADDGAWILILGDVMYALERWTRSVKDGIMETGWYLYDDQPNGYFGEWCSRRLLDAVDEANRLINRETTGAPGPEPKTPSAATAERAVAAVLTRDRATLAHNARQLSEAAARVAEDPEQAHRLGHVVRLAEDAQSLAMLATRIRAVADTADLYAVE